MKVLIPVAGAGTRLRPHTHTTPKTLLMVAGKPILGHILDTIKPLQVDELILVVGEKGDKIREYVDKNYRFKVKYAVQKEPLGLGHAVYTGIHDEKNGELLIILGDTIFEADYRGLIEKGDYVIGVKEVKDPKRFGIIEFEGDRITRVIEKPEHPPSNYAIVGIYYFSSLSPLRDALSEIIRKDIRTKNEYQLTDALALLIERGYELLKFSIDGWYDCGKVETLLETNRHLLEKYHKIRKLKGAILIPPVYIGEDCKAENAVIGPYVSVGDGVEIKNSIIRNSIVNSSSVIEDLLLEDSVIGEGARIKGSFHRVNLGDSSEIKL